MSFLLSISGTVSGQIDRQIVARLIEFIGGVTLNRDHSFGELCSRTDVTSPRRALQNIESLFG
jgi:hypothetical protein